MSGNIFSTAVLNRNHMSKIGVVAGFMAVLCIYVFPAISAAQMVSLGDEVDDTIDAATRTEIIDSVTATLDDYYVFPDVAKKMCTLVRKNLKNKKYDTLTSGPGFAGVLTEDLRSVSHDLHLRIRYDPEIAVRFAETDTVTDEMRQEELEENRYDNFGFYKVERLRGNIGYLDLRQFADARWAGQTAIGAMNFLGYSEALIIDLRQNGGGHPSMIQLITSYFFDEPKHLNSFYLRHEDTTEQFWTQAYVLGERMSDVELYVLTSSRTFSAAEEFTYNLKNMARATIIGDTTGGGAHPIDFHVFPNINTGMSVPIGRAINPISGTNWEGVGVIPDIAVPQEQALTIARMMALKKLQEKTTDEERKNLLAWDIETLESELNPIELDRATMQKYAAAYGPRRIMLEDGELYYQREGRPKYRMIPMSETLFRFTEIEYFRLQIVADEQGRITEVMGLYDNGHRDHSPRTSE